MAGTAAATPPQSGSTILLDSVATNAPTLSGTELSDNIINLSNGAVLDFANGSTLDSGSNIYVNGPSDTISVSGLFTDLGNIDVTGTNASLSIQLNGGTLAANDSVDTGVNVEAGNTLTITGGSISDQEIHVHQGTAIVTDVTLDATGGQETMSVTGGFLELDQDTGASFPLSFVTTGSSGPSTIKLDNPQAFGGSGGDTIQGFTTGDTLDLGYAIIGTIEYSNTYNALTILDPSGNTILSAFLTNPSSGFTAGTFDVNATGSTADDGFLVTQGNGDDTIITAGSVAPPSATTWTWIGTSGAYNVSGNWSQTGGGGNGDGYPVNGDTAIIPDGTMQIAGETLDLASLSLGGTPGGGAIVSGGGELEVDSGLVMLGSSLLSVDATSAVEIGGGGTFVIGAVEIDSDVTLVGSGVISGALDNNGELDSSNAPSVTASSGGTLEITGSIGGTGVITLGAGSTLKLDGAVGAGQSFSFASGTSEDLVLGTPGSGFGNAILGLATGDEIEFGNGMTVTSASLLNSNTIAVDFTSGGSSGVYDLTNVSLASGAGTSFATGTDSNTGDSFIQLTSSQPDTSSQPAPEDFSGSGTSDILFENNNSGLFLDWRLAGGAYSSDNVIAGATSDWQYVGTGDIYGGGTADILFQNVNSNVLLDWQMSGGNYTSDSVIGDVSYGWKFLGTGDFTGNGTDDILFQNSNSGELLYWNMQNGAYNGAVALPEATSDWTYAGNGNFTGNGTDDILFQNKSGLILYWNMQNGTYSQPVSVGVANAGWQVVGTGDFYGNGTSNILFENTNSNLLLDWKMVNGSYAQSTVLGTIPTGWSYVATGDYKGNGTDDILLQNKSSGQVAYWNIDNGSVTGSVNVAGATSDWKLLSN